MEQGWLDCALGSSQGCRENDMQPATRELNGNTIFFCKKSSRVHCLIPVREADEIVTAAARAAARGPS